MDALGIKAGVLILQLSVIMLLLGLPVISLMDLARKKLNGTALAIWVLVICAVPLLGSLAYWIVKPTGEGK